MIVIFGKISADIDSVISIGNEVFKLASTEILD